MFCVSHDGIYLISRYLQIFFKINELIMSVFNTVSGVPAGRKSPPKPKGPMFAFVTEINTYRILFTVY
jgi:hypothetical protein